jgi:protein TonB
MERHFGLPIAFAAAIHGAVLFGFTKEPRVKPTAKPTEVSPVIAIRVPEPEPPEIVVADDVSKPRGEPEAPQPIASPEPATVNVDAKFVINPPPVSVDMADLTKILEIPTSTTSGTKGEMFGPDIIPAKFLDNSPRARFQPAPIYPHEGKMQGLRGEVLVEFTVDENGNVIDPRVIHSSNRIFEETSLRAVAKWKFEPGRRDARVVRFRMSVPLVFNLNE